MRPPYSFVSTGPVPEARAEEEPCGPVVPLLFMSTLA